MINYRLNFLIVFFFNVTVSRAQELLTLKNAIELSLKNNYDLLLSRNEAQYATNENTPGNAGFLPQINITAGGVIANNNTNQKYSSGQEVNKNNVSSNTLNAGAELSWILFDGLKMFSTHEKLKLLNEQGQLTLKTDIENTVFSVISAYYNLIKSKQQIREYQEYLVIYEERERLTRTRFEIGSGPRTDLLQTKIDMNKLKSSLITVTDVYDVYKSELNLLLGRSAETAFDVSDSILITNTYTKDGLINSVFKNSYMLHIARNNISVSTFALKEFESWRYPRIGINAGYNFQKTENKAGFSLYNLNSGIHAGFSASWTIFNGFNTNRQIKNAKLNRQNFEIQYDYLKNSINSDLLNAWRSFENAKNLLLLEEENIMLARENAFIALHRFKSGSSDIIELREAQRSLEESITRVTNARYETGIAELLLMKLNGDLVKTN